MAEITRPAGLHDGHANALRSRKESFVEVDAAGTRLVQHGAATIPMNDWPGWPQQLRAAASGQADAVIETFVAGRDQVTPTSDNEPFVSGWEPTVCWMNATVRTALVSARVDLVGDAYITASLTPTASLEGIAHLDDDQFVPGDSVSMVAIIGEHAGPRVAINALAHGQLRPMGPVLFDPEQLEAFANGEIDHCACANDELVVFPQFGQLHAGPVAHHIEHLGATRQLLVMRAGVVPTP